VSKTHSDSAIRIKNEKVVVHKLKLNKLYMCVCFWIFQKSYAMWVKISYH